MDARVLKLRAETMKDICFPVWIPTLATVFYRQFNNLNVYGMTLWLHGHQFSNSLSVEM